MSVIAKEIHSKALWEITEDNQRIGILQITPRGITLRSRGEIEQFSNLREFKKKFPVRFEPIKQKEAPPTTAYGFKPDVKPYNIRWSVAKGLPLYTKNSKSNSYYCAGYYAVKTKKGWVEMFCPKFVKLKYLKFRGPINTKAELRDILRECSASNN